MNDISPELNQAPPKKDNKSVKSRLKKVVGKVILGTPIAGAILSSGNVDNPNIPAPKIREPTPASVSLPSTLESQKLPDYEYLSFENIKVAIDKEGLPIEYGLPGGKKGIIDQKETRIIREKAMLLKEPEIIKVIPIEKKADDIGFDYSLERPETPKLPEDVIPEKELKTRGIEIIQGSNTKLYIRKGAFDKDAPLASFSKPGSKLTIVLVDGPFVSPNFMTDPKYAGVKERLHGKMPKEKSEESTEQYREKQIKEKEREIGVLRQDVEKLTGEIQGNPAKKDLLDELSKAKEDILLHKLFAFLYRPSVLTDEAIREQMAFETNPMFNTMAGVYMPGKLFEKETFAWDGIRKKKERYLDNPIIFLPVGRVKYQGYNVIYFTPKGTVANFIYYNESDFFDELPTALPLSRHTHPRPEDFKVNPGGSGDDPKSYKYGSETSGFRLRHEIEHDIETRRPWIKEGKIPDHNEYKTDAGAMERIKMAWERWEKSGFTDDSGFYFVLSLPPEKGGGYILTEHKPSNSSASSKL